MSKIIFVIFLTINSLNGIGQQLAQFCEQQYGGRILRLSSTKIDSLKNLGIKKIICLNHYVGHSEAGYSKMIWSQNGDMKGMGIEIDQITSDELATGIFKIGQNDLNSVVQFLRAPNGTSPKGVEICDSLWISHQPYYLLYELANDKENCMSVAESETRCNGHVSRIALVNMLSRKAEFWSLVMPSKNQ
jgi:hypothetical protein